MDIEYPVTVSWEIEVPDIPMTGIIENGQGPPAVTGTVELPQGGSRQSRSFGRNTTYAEGAEPGTHVIRDTETMLKTVMPELARDAFNDIDSAAERLKDLEVFGTNLLQNRFEAVQTEYPNKDEEAAKSIIQNGAKVIVTISGHIPTKDELTQKAKEDVIKILKGALS